MAKPSKFTAKCNAAINAEFLRGKQEAEQVKAAVHTLPTLAALAREKEQQYREAREEGW